MNMLIVLLLVVGFCNAQNIGESVFGGSNNPYAIYPIKQGPIEERPMIIKQPQPAILQTYPTKLMQLQQDLADQQQALIRAQQAHSATMAQIQANIDALQQQINVLKKNLIQY